MRRSIRESASRTVMMAVLLAVGAPAAAFAQGGEGYLFKRPRITIKFETGYGFQRASSDIFDFVIEEHTVGRRDFDSPYLGGEIGLRLSERLDLAFNFGGQYGSVGSEFREWVDTDDLPINQVTELRQMSMVGGVKYYPFDRGRTIGRFVWIPRSVTPFIGAGLGIVSYSFEQIGDFVDYDTFDILRTNS